MYLRVLLSPSRTPKRNETPAEQLETERALLEPKARQALERYGHQIVIGNMLATRKHEVDFITPDSHEKVALTMEEIAAGREIEAKIIPELVRRHDRWIAGQAAG
ncbi:MAG: hypothetical protein BJ554DRAFT_1904 [Olpidium bornovanus]|uniref:Uncharacterized protein n=1 Tax=Olpidium bornovanus TaxID=278681 RepID=A0A8H7ZRN7_9FUNG|nr:MAG: hypothetical protein BJ554DRAFT_1904 [Olpidium bornovanus]